MMLKNITIGKITTLFLSLGVIIFFSLQAQANDDGIVVYAQIKGFHADNTPAFRTIVIKSISELQHFKVVNGVRGTIATSKSIKERIDAAREGSIPWIADVVLDSEKHEGKLSFDIYRNNGENEFHWQKDVDIDSVKAFLASMEYQIPFKLKTKFLELGKIIKLDKRLAYFDLGKTAGVNPGDIYRVYKRGQQVKDDDGNSFGYLEKTTGIIRVTQVTEIYSIAEIIIGKLSIDTDQWVKRAKEQDISKYQGSIEAVLENNVAINVGKNVGVEEGSYYAVFRDIKPINSNEAFRQAVGYIKINEVYDNFSKGELSISDTYDLSKYTIKKGDHVEEVESPRKNMWSFSQIVTHVSSQAGARILVFGYQRDSMVNVDMVYRFRAGYGHGNTYVAGGVMYSLAHSAHTFAGMDAIYAGSGALNLFLSVDVDTPVSPNLKINLESGFMIAHKNDLYNGLNAIVGIKYAYNIF